LNVEYITCITILCLFGCIITQRIITILSDCLFVIVQAKLRKLKIK